MDEQLVERYLSPSGAAAYRGKYERSLSRRLSHRREMRMVLRALRRAGAKGRVLDCPCGAGRLAPTLLRLADHVTCTDLSPAMVAEARDALSSVPTSRVSFEVAPANQLPFEDRAFDTAVCHRLIHHMNDPAERAGVLREMARVARRRVVISFSDDTTWKAKSQHRRGVARRRHALTPEALCAEAAAFGLTPIGRPMRLNPFFSLVAVMVFDASGSTAARE
jgi:ubiquinone/menaquinone biosynthesis C-methylase UbiE